VTCTLDVALADISCQASGYQEGAQLTWTSTASWANSGGHQWDFSIHDELVAPITSVFLEECRGSNCQTIETSIDTSALVPDSGVVPSTTVGSTVPSETGGVAELTVDCSFDEPNRQLSCEANRQGNWVSSLHPGASSYGITYEYSLGWGEFVEEISVQFTESLAPSESITTILDVALQPRGDCPDDFNGWFTTFPLEDLELVFEVGPPVRFVTEDVLKPHGYFRVPWGQNAHDVRLPADGTLYHGGNYMAMGLSGEIVDLQYRLEFRTKCEGLRFRLDHIGEPIPEIAALFTREPQVHSSIEVAQSGGDYDLPLFEMKEGDLVGTSIGMPSDIQPDTGLRGNASLDLGVYDDFHRVLTSQDPRFTNAACYYDFFSPEIATYLRSKTLVNTPLEESLSWCPTSSEPPAD
jgi:hypothetical protein